VNVRRYEVGRGSTHASKRYDVIVVGVGAMGSAAAYYLARRGKRVLGLERFDIPHSMGSSHGETRIIRLAYYEDPSYVMLLHRSYELWRALQSRAGEHLLWTTGSVDAGPPDSWVFKGSLRSCLEHDLPHEVLTARELKERFPGYGLPQETLAVFQPEGGFLLPERCIVSFVQSAHAEGAEIHGRETVLGWEPIGDGVRVTTDHGRYEADRLVVTGGAWNRKLLPFLRDLAVPERQVLAWLQPERPDDFTPDRFPVFNLIVEEGRFYGFPVFGVPGFKFGKYHHFEEQWDPDDLDREPRWEDEQVLRNFAGRHFPTGYGPTMSLQVCLFTNSPDKHFIIDTHPHYPQVSFASACSGHGFKFASVIGEILADLAEREVTRHNIELFRLDRLFGVRPEQRRPRLPVGRLGPAPRRLARMWGGRPERVVRARGGLGRTAGETRGGLGRTAGETRGGHDRAAARSRSRGRHGLTEGEPFLGDVSTVADEQAGAVRSFW
jgi:sarcosine oxidase